jgi:hypothetical protein
MRISLPRISLVMCRIWFRRPGVLGSSRTGSPGPVSGCLGFCRNNRDPSRRGRHLKLLSVKVLRRRVKPPIGVVPCKSQIWCRKVLRGNGLRRKSFRVSRTGVKWFWCKGLWLGAESFVRWGRCESAYIIADHSYPVPAGLAQTARKVHSRAWTAGRSKLSKNQAGTAERAAAVGGTFSMYSLGRRFARFFFGPF